MKENIISWILVVIFVVGLVFGGTYALNGTSPQSSDGEAGVEMSGMGSSMMRHGMMNGNMMGRGMMDQMQNQDMEAFQQGNGQMGPGQMMGGNMMGPGSMMGSGTSGCPMMGGMMGYYSGVPELLSPDDAKAIADNYLASLKNQDLEIGEFEEYSHNFYVSLVEKSTGRGAIEIIIDRYSGSLRPEPQSMMWNEKYGMMGRGMMGPGMMSGGRMGSYQQAQMSVTPQQAVEIAQDFLDVVYPGTEADEILTYYGYYTIMTTLGGKHFGMLSVNGYSGDLWYHTWHGMFISEVENH